MRGQLSAEMLILITVVLAIVAIAATQLMNTAQDTATNINESAGTLGEMTIPCIDVDDCNERCSKKSGECVDGICVCD